MAQIVRLRRSSVVGKKPTNAQLELGELSINTSDGKVFLAKSGSGGPSIEELISTNTVNTGSINLIGDVTASNFSGSFIGNGSGITNVISSSYAVTSSYANLAFTIESSPGTTQFLTVSTPSTTWYFNHNLGEQYPVIQVYDDNGFVVIPSSIEMFSTNTAIITFSLAQSGYATATVGGGLPAISSSYDGRILQTNGVGASWNTISGMGFATTGSNSFNGNQLITGSVNITSGVTVTGSINVAAGIIVTGSNRFNGNQTITGSINVSSNAIITGSLNVSSNSSITGSLNVSTGLTISNGSVTMPNRPAFRVYGSGTTNNLTPSQNGTGTLTNANYAVDYTQGSGFTASTGIFVAPIAGLYSIHIVGRFAGYAGGISQLAVLKNNSNAAGNVGPFLEWAPSSTMIHVGSSTVMYLAVNDTLRLKVLTGEITFDQNDSYSVTYIG